MTPDIILSRVFIHPLGFFLLWHPNTSIVGASAIGPVLISMESHLYDVTLCHWHTWTWLMDGPPSISVQHSHRNTYVSKTDHHRWLLLDVLEQRYLTEHPILCAQGNLYNLPRFVLTSLLMPTPASTQERSTGPHTIFIHHYSNQFKVIIISSFFQPTLNFHSISFDPTRS